MYETESAHRILSTDAWSEQEQLFKSHPLLTSLLFSPQEMGKMHTHTCSFPSHAGVRSALRWDSIKLTRSEQDKPKKKNKREKAECTNIKYYKWSAHAGSVERDLLFYALIYNTGSDTWPEMMISLMPTGPWDWRDWSKCAVTLGGSTDYQRD